MATSSILTLRQAKSTVRVTPTSKLCPLAARSRNHPLACSNVLVSRPLLPLSCCLVTNTIILFTLKKSAQAVHPSKNWPAFPAALDLGCLLLHVSDMGSAVGPKVQSTKRAKLTTRAAHRVQAAPGVARLSAGRSSAACACWCA